MLNMLSKASNRLVIGYIMLGLGIGVSCIGGGFMISGRIK